jgi:S-DNA-T family DNA segregation ATPase FtsK/SpoIIIE
MLRWTMIVGPLGLGAAMAVILKRPTFAILMMLGPVMAALNWIESRRSGRKTDRLADAVYRAAVSSAIKNLRTWLASTQAAALNQHPDLPSVLSWPALRHPRLWERRPHHSDFGQVMVGYAPLHSRLNGGKPIDPRFSELLARGLPAATLPIVVDLSPGRVVGIVGPDKEVGASARAIVAQLAIHHGPADLVIRVAAAPSRAPQWGWTALLPHARIDQGQAAVEVTREAVEGLLTLPEPTLVVIDGSYEPALSGLVREFAASAGSILVTAATAEELPAAVDQIVRVASPDITAFDLASGSVFAGSGLFAENDVCADAARALLGISDPELATNGLVPATVALVDLLGPDEIDEDTVINRWRQSPDRIAAPIGISSSGVVEIDIVRDGPHGLLAGTTGAGKSELLRTLVASLAATVDPEHLNFVLIDYKGGSAFDACADLPHVVGVVTDLDDHLAARAMTCLEAELGYRERVLRQAGASDLSGYGAIPDQPPLPRLYLVVDEFAAMAGDLPDFMDALVDIAARGRSLGVHLMLATQRPAGVVKDTIRANTNLRIALRVQTVADSRDVLDDGIAALLPRSIPGRGYVRFGPSELTGFQTALVTRSSSDLAPARVELHTIGLPGRPDCHGEANTGITDLERLVTAIRAAARQTGMTHPRTPWPPGLPKSLALSSLTTDPGAFGLIDEPGEQRQRPFIWDRSKGHLALYGMPGSGPERAAESAVASVCAAPGDLQVFVLTFGNHRYESLADISGITPILEPDDLERQTRLIRYLGDELRRRRRSASSPESPIIVVIDDIEACLKSLEPFHLGPLLETVTDILTRGYTARIHVVATAFSSAAVRTRVAIGFTTRLAFGFADRSHYAGLGIGTRHLPAFGFGRGIDVSSERMVQVATDHSGLQFPTRAVAPPIRIMPSLVEGLHASARTVTRPWHIPLGIGERHLTEIGVDLDVGDHLLVAGPVRSGKSTTLALIARQVHSGNPGARLVAVTPRRSWLGDATRFEYVVDDPAAVPELGHALATADRPILVLVDDAELVEGFEDILKTRHPNVTVVAAIRSTEATRLYTHWTRRLRDSGTVLLLGTDNGDPVGLKVPKLLTSPPAGRGFLCIHGSVEGIQVAKG